MGGRAIPGTRPPANSSDAPASERITELPLFKHELVMWTFVWVEGIEPTNNDAPSLLPAEVELAAA